VGGDSDVESETGPSREAVFCFCEVSMCCSVAVCCSVLQCIAVCCSVLQCVAVYCSVLKVRQDHRVKQSSASVRSLCVALLNFLQCVAVCGSTSYDGPVSFVLSKSHVHVACCK